jgi:hypothetical protein
MRTVTNAKTAGGKIAATQLLLSMLLPACRETFFILSPFCEKILKNSNANPRKYYQRLNSALKDICF